jgi:hypothetical protein
MNKAKSDHSRIPLPDLIQEGSNKQYVCNKDRTVLLCHGLDDRVFITLEQYTRACIDAETAWQIGLREKKIATAKCSEAMVEGKKYRAKLAKQVRKNPLVKMSGHTIPEYGDRRTHADIIEDLYELHTLGCKLLEVDPQSIPNSSTVQKALELHKKLRALRVQLAVLKSRKALCCTARTKAARTLKNLIDTIHLAGQNAFADEPEKAARYKYGFYQEQNSKRKKIKPKIESPEKSTVPAV